ncbi:LacI family DNA-binding transcriptional regulator [Lentzea pudingi]|uniref:LacI family DNA-binding transcriptional regulator n=1 Tax=Lentzea pudingi TaxID=1789439 RepID=UPI001669F270|nr:LacI family DNA-binding transcriptional regulator [Lentzea pudingi]
MTTGAQARRSRPRIDEVAHAAGVSKSTVSRVINDEPYVSQRSRDAVNRAIERLGFSPNHAARTLAGSKANAIAMVVQDHGSHVLTDPFVASVLRGVHAELAGQGIHVLLMTSQYTANQDLATYLTGGHVDGVLVLCLHCDDPLPRMLRESDLPVVMGGRPLAGGDIPFVDADNFNGALEAARHLVTLGRTRISTIAGPSNTAVGMERLSGWRRGLGEQQIPTDLFVHSDFTFEGGARAMNALLNRAPDLDAVFAAADIMALGALDVLHARGKRVPDDVAIIGFDDSAMALNARPALTTVRQDIEQLGSTMAWRLIAELAGEPQLPSSVLLPTSLVRRLSA